MNRTQKATSERLLDLRHITSMQFRREHWQKAAELTGCMDLIGCYERLGEVHWGDAGYDACVLHVLTSMLERNPEAITVLEQIAESVCSGMEDNALAYATLTRL